MTYQVILTTTGAAKLAAGIVNLTHMAIGDANGTEYQPTGDETALVQEVYRQPLSAYNVTSNKVVMQLSIPLGDGGFYIREAGIYDDAGDMIYIANLATRYKPLPTEGSPSDLTITLVSTVSNIANLSVTVDGTAYVTESVLTAALVGKANITYVDDGLSEKVDKVTGKGLSTNDYTTTEKNKLAGIASGATANTAASDTEAQAGTNAAKFMTPAAAYAAYGAADPVVLTSGNSHAHAVAENIITGAIAPMTVNLADIANYPKSKLNRIALTIANLSNNNWTVNGNVNAGGNVALSITGATTAAPTYALDATSLPTVVNGTIASNLFTATANAASAQSFDYVAAGTVTAITPTMTFTPGAIFTVDPTSTIGGLKLNSSQSGLLTNGDPLIVDDGSSVSETSGVTVSQSTISFVDSSWRIILFYTCNGVVFGIGSSNFKLMYSLDSGSTWKYATQLPGSGTINTLTGMAYFNNKYFLALSFNSSQAVNLFSSIDLKNWDVAHSQNFSNSGSCGVATNGTILSVIYSCNNADNNATIVYPFTSIDGVNFTGQSTFNTAASTINSSVMQYEYWNGKFIGSLSCAAIYSADGVNFTKYDWPNNTSGNKLTSVIWTGTYYLAGDYVYLAVPANRGIWNSTNFTSWNNKWGLGNSSSYYVSRFFYSNNNYMVYYNVSGVMRVQTSDGNTFSGATLSPSLSPGGGTLPIRGTCGINSTTALISNNSRLTILQTTSNNLYISTSLSTIAINYQYTITSPSLSVAVPSFVAKGGQQLQYSVSATSTLSFSTATLSYTRSGNVITATGTVATVNGQHVQIKALLLNNGDILSQISATLATGVAQTINGNNSLTIAAGKVTMLIPTTSGWLASN